MTLPDVEEEHDGADDVVKLLQGQPEDRNDGWKEDSNVPAEADVRAEAADDPADVQQEEAFVDEAVDDQQEEEPGEQDDVEEIEVDQTYEIDNASNVSWHPE